VKKNE